jgi:guanylate kinase
MHQKRAILFSAPSGSGKTTIIHRLLQRFDCFEFSISATSRKPRGEEQDGVDYYYLTKEEFMRRVKQNDFVEWEEVYEGTCYGTLKSELNRIWDNGHYILFDVDVKGGMNLKQYFGADALSLFIMPPSLEILEQRLRMRGTDSEESISKRLQRAAVELEEAKKFDHIIVNDHLDETVDETEQLIRAYLGISQGCLHQSR